MRNKRAPNGKVYQCQACGKLSLDLYGDEALSYGWDVSCVMNAQLVDAKDYAEQIAKARPYKSRDGDGL